VTLADTGGWTLANYLARRVMIMREPIGVIRDCVGIVRLGIGIARFGSECGIMTAPPLPLGQREPPMPIGMYTGPPVRPGYG
jgi:hypothetical protein